MILNLSVITAVDVIIYSILKPLHSPTIWTNQTFRTEAKKDMIQSVLYNIKGSSLNKKKSNLCICIGRLAYIVKCSLHCDKNRHLPEGGGDTSTPAALGPPADL